MSSQVGRLSSLIDAAVAVVEEVDLDQVLRRLVTEARAATGATYAALGVLGPHGVLTDFVHEGLPPGVSEQIGQLPQGRGVLGTVVRRRETLLLDHIADHQDSYGFPANHPPMDNFLGVPVRAGEVVFGNLYLTEKPGGFTDDDVATIEALATIAGAAISTSRLHNRLRHAAVIEDRDRIARDLHDSVIQDLFAIGLGLQGLAGRLDDPHISVVLDDAVDRLHASVEALREYIFELKTAPGSDTTLFEQLSELADRLGSAYSVEIVVDFDGPPSDVDPRTADEIVKLATEALSNALRHSSAGLIGIETSTTAGMLSLRVVDDGVGFDVDTAGPGLGLLNLAERARRVGGRVIVDSTPGKGTVVVIEVPVS